MINYLSLKTLLINELQLAIQDYTTAENAISAPVVLSDLQDASWGTALGAATDRIAALEGLAAAKSEAHQRLRAAYDIAHQAYKLLGGNEAGNPPLFERAPSGGIYMVPETYAQCVRALEFLGVQS